MCMCLCLCVRARACVLVHVHVRVRVRARMDIRVLRQEGASGLARSPALKTIISQLLVKHLKPLSVNY